MKELGAVPYIVGGFSLFFILSLIFEAIMPLFLLALFIFIAGIIIYESGTGTPKQQYGIRASRTPHNTNDYLANMFRAASSAARNQQSSSYYAPRQTGSQDDGDQQKNKQAAAPSLPVMVLLGILALWLLAS